MRGRNFLKRKIYPPHPLFKELNKGNWLNAKINSRPCHPERRKSHGVRFSQSNPTIGRARSGISNQFSLSSAEIPNDTSHRSILATLGFRLRSG